MLSQQISLDQKFRETKLIFSEWSEPKKWELLTNKYQEKYKGSNIEEVKEVFRVHSEEHNPFF